jgi:hypothetical protein
MERSGTDSVRSQARNVERVLNVLEKHDVEISPDSIKLTAKKR